MDLSSILPLLMQQRGGDKTDMSAIVNAFTGKQTADGAQNTGQAANLAQMLGAINGGKANAGVPSDLLSALTSGGGQNPNLNLVSLLSTMGNNKRNAKRPSGLKPVKAFMPDEFLGRLVKYFNT